jgi:hypothetical protein
MLKHLRQHFVGYLALFVALSGSAYAASLPRNSVGTKQLKNHAVTAPKLASGLIPHVPAMSWVMVNANGTIALGHGVKSVVSHAPAVPGTYTVTFTRKANACAVAGSVNDAEGSPQKAAVTTAIQGNGTVNVQTMAAASTTLTPEPFTILMICA